MATAGAPDYEGNAALMDAYAAPIPLHSMAAITRTYHPQYLPSYVDEKDSDGNVTRAAEDMYAVAIPKVVGTVSAVMPFDLCQDYSLRFPIFRGTLVRAHWFVRYSTSYQYGEFDPYANPEQNPNKTVNDDESNGSDPLKPIWYDPSNPHCNEPMYLMLVLHYKYTDKDGVEHKVAEMINSRNGESEVGSVKPKISGTVTNDCAGQYRGYDNTNGWNNLVKKVGYGSCGADVYPEEGGTESCGAKELPPTESPCVATCVTSGQVDDGISKLKGPLFSGVEIATSFDGTRKIARPTRVVYYVCFDVTYAKQNCVTSQTTMGKYGGLLYDWCSCHGFLIRTTYSLGEEIPQTDPSEHHELCIPYEIPIKYDENGCPEVDHDNDKKDKDGNPIGATPMGETPGQNTGDYDSGDPDVYITFEMVPQSAIPAEWVDNTNNSSGSLTTTIGLYDSFSDSSLHRLRMGGLQ